MLAQLIGRVSDNHPDCIGIDWLVFDNSFVVSPGSFFTSEKETCGWAVNLTSSLKTPDC